MLTSNLQQPMVSETSMLLDLLHSFNVLSDLGVQGIGGDVEVTTVSVVLSSVEEPGRNAVGCGVENDLGDFLPRLFADLAGTLGDVDLGQLADQVSQSSSYTLDGCNRVGYSSFTFDVSVENSDNVLEFCCFVIYETLALLILP